jgi:hypothetical protein
MTRDATAPVAELTGPSQDSGSVRATAEPKRYAA